MVNQFVFNGGAPVFVGRPRGPGRWSWYGCFALSLMIRGCQAPGFVEAPILGFLSSRGFCPGLVDPFGMDLDGRSVVNR